MIISTTLEVQCDLCDRTETVRSPGYSQLNSLVQATGNWKLHFDRGSHITVCSKCINDVDEQNLEHEKYAAELEARCTKMVRGFEKKYGPRPAYRRWHLLALERKGT
jgi:hypothetical protein